MENRRASSFDPRGSFVSTRIVRGLVQAVEEAGVAPEELLLVAQLDPARLARDEVCVPRSMVYLLCERALDLTGDPALGLHWGERLREPTFNPVSHLIAHSADLRQAFESLRRFHRLLSDQPSFVLSESGAKVTVSGVNQPGASLRMVLYRPCRPESQGNLLRRNRERP